MPVSLPELEAERSQILRQFTTLSDLRPGSICAVSRRCGKSTCHCAKPGDPGARSPDSADAEGRRENCCRIVPLSRRLAEGPIRGR